jgi:hypothetical protein
MYKRTFRRLSNAKRFKEKVKSDRPIIEKRINGDEIFIVEFKINENCRISDLKDCEVMTERNSRPCSPCINSFRII